MAINQNATINVAVTGQQSIDRLQASINKTSDAFAGLKSALGALAIGSFVTQAYRMANALSDLGKATGISTQAILGFTQAVAANGGSIDGATIGISKFAQSVEAAAGGSKEMQDKFLKLGITLNDLRTLSEQDLLRKTVEGLGRAGPGAITAATGMSLFGKAARSTDWAGVARDIESMTKAADGAGIDAAGQASQNFSNALVIVQRQLLTALKPLSDLALKILESTNAVSKFVGVAVDIALVVGSFFLVGKAVSLVVKGFQLLTGAFATISAGASTVGKTFTMMGYTFTNIVKSFGEGIGRIISAFGMLAKNFGFLKDGLGMLAKGFAILGSAAYAAWKLIVPESVQQMLSDLFGDTKDGLDSVTEGQNKAGDAATKAGEQQAAAAREVQAALQKEIDALGNLLTSYQAVNEAANKKFQLETDALNLSEAQRMSQQERFGAEATFLKEMAKLTEQYQEKSKSASESDLAMLPQITAAMSALSDTYNKQIGVVDELVAARVRAVQAQQLELFTIKQQTQLTEDLAEVQHRMATSTMSEIERKYADIDFAAQKSARAAIAAEEARRNAALSPEEARAYYDAAIAGSDKLKRSQQAEYENSRKFSTGWSRAFREYADNATNAARTAENLFKKATQGMEDAIVNFAKTGKFEWKSFVNMMLEELLRAQIQSIFAQLLGTMQGGMRGMGSGGGGGGGGGILGGVASLFGGGGSSGGGKSSGGGGLLGSIVGGISSIFGGGKSAGNTGGGTNRMPEVFGTSGGGIGGGSQGGGGILGTIGSGIKSAFNGITSIFSGGGGSGGGVYGPTQSGGNIDGGGFLSSIGSGISSAVSGIGDFFSGFFANGGNIPQGRFGIVGEAGPEYVGGPASVAPMSGSNVTYNINAVDAQSFQALLARDPSFIYALTEQGRRGYAGAR